MAQPRLETLYEICRVLASDGGRRFTVDRVHDVLHSAWKESGEQDHELQSLAIAFGYFMDNSEWYRSALVDAEDGQPLSEGPFGPMFEMRNPDGDGWGHFPPALRRLPDDVLDIWVEYACQSALHPLLRSRLADLLWVRKYDQQRHRWHEIAVGAYVDLVREQDVQVLEREKGVIRAVNLARESKQTGLEKSAWDALNDLVSILLVEEGECYGPVGRCLSHLAARKQPCRALVDQAISKYRTDPHKHMQLWCIKAQAEDLEADPMQCIIEAINILVADADSSPGLRQLSLLRDAASLARDQGLHDVARDLDARIARVNLEDDLIRVEHEVEISHEEVEAVVNEVIGDAESLSDALLAFGRQMPIETEEQNRQNVTNQVDETPLQYLVGRIEIDSVGDQITTSDAPSIRDPDFMDREVRRLERQQIDVFAWLVGCNVLREIDRRYSPTLEALAEHFRCAWISDDLARRIAKSFLHWREGDQDSAVSVVVLTVEAAIRKLAESIDVTVTQTKPGPGGSAVGEAATLGVLLNRIASQPAFAEAQLIPRYLDSALTHRWSMNLRNLLAHSLTNLTEPQYVVLLHIVCLLRWLAEHAQNTDDTHTDPKPPVSG